MWIVFIVISVIAFIITTIKMIIALNKKAIEFNKDKKYNVECEKCKTKKETIYDELMKTNFYKTKRLSVTVNDNKLVYIKTYSKKLYCEKCKKKTWHKILCFNEKSIDNTKNALPIIVIYFFALVIEFIFLISLYNLLSIFI